MAHIANRSRFLVTVKNRDDLTKHFSFDKLDQHYLELRQWAEHMDKARELAAAFAQTPAFVDMLVDALAPNEVVDWAEAGVVRALKDAEEQNSTDGWCRLDVARTWMALHHPDETPERYACKTWQQVLHESRAFRLEYRQVGARKVAWFRARD